MREAEGGVGLVLSFPGAFKAIFRVSECFLSLHSSAVVVSKGPEILCDDAARPTVPWCLYGANPAVSAPRLSPVLGVGFSIDSGVVVGDACYPAIVQACVYGYLKDKAVVGRVQATCAHSNRVVVASFKALTVRGGVLLPPVVRAVARAAHGG